MIFEMNVNPEPFVKIKSGLKTIELRLNDEKRSKIAVGDTIIFTNTTDTTQKLTSKVINIHKFSNFEELYKELPLLKCGYTDENISTAKASDMNAYYSNEQISKYGVIGIEIELI